MPSCPICSKPCGCNEPPNAVGSIVLSCSKHKGAIWVHVVDDLGDNVKGAHTLKDATAKQGTGPTGLSTYDPLDAGGPFTISLDALSSELADEYEPPVDAKQPVFVSDGQITYVGFQLKRKTNEVKPTLTLDKHEVQAAFPDAKAVAAEIHVFQPKKPDTKDDPEVVLVTVSYTESLPAQAFDKGGTVAVTGVKATFWKDDKCQTPIADNSGQLVVEHGDLKSGYKFYLRLEAGGDAQVALTLDRTTKDRVVVDTTPKTDKVTVKPVNRVTPYIKVEHLVVLRDQEFGKKQRKNDTEAGSAAADADDQIKPDPTRIELSAAKTADSPAYTGKGKLSFTDPKVKVFEDEDCKKPFDLGPGIDFAKLAADKPVTLWLLGEAPGTFTAHLKLDPSNDATIKVDDEATGEMGCVELKAKLHHYKKADVNQAVEPDVADVDTFWNELKGLTLEQKEMTDDERVGTGRMIHVQKDKNYARAKLVIERVKDQWPAAAKDYQIVLDAADWDKKKNKRSGSLKVFDAAEDGTEITLPKKLTLDQADEKKDMWVEGATPCDGWRGIRLSAGFDRDPSGPDKKAKLDGDWGVFTVIRIKEVKCGVDNEVGQEKFIDGTKVFINLDDKGRLLKSVGGKRKAEITATIEPALKDVDIYFQLVEHADNYKIATLPDNFKQKKIAALKHTLKPIDKDDRKKLLHMSAKTDDTGKAKIETLQTPQLGLHKFKVGAYVLQDPEQARYIEDHADLKKRAPAMSADWLEVWRRLFFKAAIMDRFSGVSYADRFDSAGIIASFRDTGIELERVAPDVNSAYVTVVTDVLTWARTELGGAAAARTLYLGVINANGNVGYLPPETYNLGAPGNTKTPTWDIGYRSFTSTTDPAKWLVSCTLSYDGSDYDVAAATTLTQDSDFHFTVGVDLDDAWNQIESSDGAAAANDMLVNGHITINWKQAKAYSGWSVQEAVLVCMYGREPKHSVQNAKDSATHTFLHEIGHYVGLAGKFQPDEAATPNPNFYSEQPGEVSARGKGGYGTGPHCDGLTDRCILWFQFKMTLEYCPMCKLFLRARALHAPKVVARATI